MITRYFKRGTLNCVMSLLLRRIHREEEVNKILGLKKPTLLSLFENINNTQRFLWLNLSYLSPRIRQAYGQFASGETLPQIPAVTLPFFPFFIARVQMIIGLRTQLLSKANAWNSCWRYLWCFNYFTLLYSFGLAHQHLYNLNWFPDLPVALLASCCKLP